MEEQETEARKGDHSSNKEENIEDEPSNQSDSDRKVEDVIKQYGQMQKTTGQSNLPDTGSSPSSTSDPGLVKPPGSPATKRKGTKASEEVRPQTPPSPRKIKKEEDQQHVQNWFTSYGGSAGGGGGGSGSGSGRDDDDDGDDDDDDDDDDNNNDDDDDDDNNDDDDESRVKWKFLQHRGPLFAAPYERLPPDVKLIYNGEPVDLALPAEEVATYYAQLLGHECLKKEQFSKNFLDGWRQRMTDDEREKIKELRKCDFSYINDYLVTKSKELKSMSLENRRLKEQVEKEYATCTIDGRTEHIKNYKIEPPGLFQGRGSHPKSGTIKERVLPNQVTINCSRDSVVPKPPDGTSWKEVVYNQNVTWLACWRESVQGHIKYMWLSSESQLKGKKDHEKYETARELRKNIHRIRREYEEDINSENVCVQQRGTALFLIDKLALRPGHEKKEDQADTFGCCSLKVRHLQLYNQKDGKENVIVLDFLGKDSIRYYNEVSVEKNVFLKLRSFMQNKTNDDALFDLLSVSMLNQHLKHLMEGLTAKVFRTFNASLLFEEQLNYLTKKEFSESQKIHSFHQANYKVAVLCNHQKAASKTHSKAMEAIREKIKSKKNKLEEAKHQYDQEKKDSSCKSISEKQKKVMQKLTEQVEKLELQAIRKEDNKCIALNTSRLNYIDPRITVAWCKRHNISIEKVFSKTEREKFKWAIETTDQEFKF